MERLRIPRCVWLIVAGLLLASCGGGAAPAAPASSPAAAKPAASKALTHVRFALANPIINPGLSYTWIGSYFNWYQDQGIDLEIVRTQNPADATQRAAAGQVE